jgi:serine protease Do
VFPALVFVKPIVEDYGSGEKKQQEVFGSGVIISPDGYAVTNWHVVDKAVTINCVLYDKQQVRAEFIGSDRDTDLAVLKLPEREGGKPYPCARLADSAAIQEGDFVMALGSPFGFQRSISLGIVSNAQRYIGFTTEYKYNTWIHRRRDQSGQQRRPPDRHQGDHRRHQHARRRRQRAGVQHPGPHGAGHR